MSKNRFERLLAKPPADPPQREPGKVETVETQEIIVHRPVGKRSKDEYTQVSAYIPKDTHKSIKAALLDEERDFSELVSDLLADWLKTRGAK